MAELGDRLAEAEIGRPEVVPHCEMQCASSTTKSATFTRDSEERKAGVAEPLGSDVGDAGPRLHEPRQRSVLLARAERRVEPQHLDAEHLELIVLIFHERDERRDDERGAGELERR